MQLPGAQDESEGLVHLPPLRHGDASGPGTPREGARLILTRTPFRVSLFGGGTDLPAWFTRPGGTGQVLSTAIDKYCWISVRRLPPFFEHRHRIVYTKVETVATSAEIQHPAVRAAFRRMRVLPAEGLEVHHDGDLPARSGIGSSSSFAVGLLHALHALRGNRIAARELAAEAIELERTDLAEAGGWQDQIAAAHGGFNRIRFQGGRDVAAPYGGAYDVEPVILPHGVVEELQDSLQLYWTGLPRSSAAVQESWAVAQQEAALAWNAESVDQALQLLQVGDVPKVGNLLHEAWARKRELSPAVTTPEVDDIYREAVWGGALGGKLLGAGGGGFLLLLVPPAAQAAVRARLFKLTLVPFRFCRAGSRVVVYEPE